MSRGINKVILVGNLGKDPEARQGATGFTIATSESWKDKGTGEQVERTEWHRCVAFGRLADICAEYLRKGSQVYVEGQLRTRKWQNSEGRDQYTTEVVVQEMQMLGGRPKPEGDSHAGMPEAARRPAAARQPAPAGAAPGDPGGFGAFDDDIPF